MMPLGQFQQLFVAPLAVAHRQAEESVEHRDGDGRSDRRPAFVPRTEAETTRQLRHVHVGHDSRHLITRPPTASSVLVGVVALSLVVGGIVIMNIMLMAVSERTREIGLRKALCARVDILAQMLTESVVLSVFGGVIGTVFGSAIATAIASFTPIPASVELWSVALGIFVTAFVGLFFGLYPASRAASLDLIEALRRE